MKSKRGKQIKALVEKHLEHKMFGYSDELQDSLQRFLREKMEFNIEVSEFIKVDQNNWHLTVGFLNEDNVFSAIDINIANYAEN